MTAPLRPTAGDGQSHPETVGNGPDDVSVGGAKEPLPPHRVVGQNRQVSAEEVDRYLGSLEDPKRATLVDLRRTILAIIPDAEQGISYGAPAFRVRGKTVAGFAAFKNHLSYLPHSGSVFPELGDELSEYAKSSGALRFPIDQPLSRELVEKLIQVRLEQAFPG